MKPPLLVVARRYLWRHGRLWKGTSGDHPICRPYGSTWLQSGELVISESFFQGFSSLAHPQIDPNHPVCFSSFFSPQFEVLPKKTWKVRRCHGSAHRHGLPELTRLDFQAKSIHISFPNKRISKQGSSIFQTLIYCKLWSQTLSIPEECVFHTWGPQPHEQTSQQPEHRCDTPTKWADDIPTCLDHDRSRDTHGCNLMDRLQCCWSQVFIVESQVF